MESMMHLSSNNHFITKLVIKFSLILQYICHIQVDKINLYWCCKNYWKIIKYSGNQENAYLNKRNTRASTALKWALDPDQLGLASLWGHQYPCFGFLVISQSQSGICLICIAEANIIYIPWDPPLVLHIANLWTVRWDSNLRWQPNIATYWRSGLESNSRDMCSSAVCYHCAMPACSVLLKKILTSFYDI